MTPDGGKPVRVVLATRADPEGGGDGGGMAAAEVPPFTERPYARAEDKEETIRMVHLSAADGTDVPPVAALESHYKSTVFEHAVVYAILVPTAGGGEIYVGATTSWPRRLHEHLNGQGSRALYALVEHVEKEEREAFVSAAILLDLAADVGDMPAFLDAVLGECGGHTHHTVDSVRFLIHHFEAIGLEELFLDDELSKLARLNRNPGAFGHLITCYAEANGARSTAIGADGRAGTASRGGHGMACEDRGALGTAIGADGRAGTGSRGGHGMACEDRGALGTAIGADGRAGTGSRSGHGMACEDRGRSRAKRSAIEVTLEDRATGQRVVVHFRRHDDRSSRLFGWLGPQKNGVRMWTRLETVAREFAINTQHPRPVKKHATSHPATRRTYSHVVVVPPSLGDGASPSASASPPSYTSTLLTTPSTSSVPTPTGSAATPEAAPSFHTGAVASIGIRRFFSPTPSTTTTTTPSTPVTTTATTPSAAGDGADGDGDRSSGDDFE